MGDVIHGQGIRGFISMGKPQHYDEPHFVPRECVDHPGLELVETRQYLEVCDCSWPCRHPTQRLTLSCPVDGCLNHYDWTV